jgi:hypothetical protein
MKFCINYKKKFTNIYDVYGGHAKIQKDRYRITDIPG